MRPRVGHIQFINCLPIYYGLVKNGGILDLSLVKGTPTELNSKLVGGELDISPISSIEYARHPEELLLLPGPTVSCRGPVLSILLISRVPVENLDGRRVALTNTSATSHVLLKILFEKKYGIRPEYFISGDDLPEALHSADAALLIGDSALRNLQTEGGLKVYDLGEQWHDLTGYGMVFAVWAVRRGYAMENPAIVSHAFRLFRNSISYCSANRSSIAQDAARWEPFSALFLETYFRSLSFEFQEDLLDGLRLFYRLAAEIGELEVEPEIEFFFIEPERRYAESCL